MANKFTRLYIANTIASGSNREWKKLSSTLQLPAPTLSLNGNTLTITDESGLATSFDIFIDGEREGTTIVTAIDLSVLVLKEGTHSITVIAMADGYVDSEISAAVEYTVESGGETVEGCILFSSLSSFTLNIVDNTKYWDGTLEYSTDNNTWSEWDGTTTLSADSGVLYMRGTGNTAITGKNASTGAAWTLEGSKIYCRGNIENLLDYAMVANGEHPAMAQYCYTLMFLDCTSLTTAPELPATTLARSCYTSMFNGCTSLTTAPELPATTLAEWCYSKMFNGCTSLTTAPELPATTLANYCYFDMFNGCTSIKLSAEQTDEYTTAYRIPTSGEGTIPEDATYALTNMFTSTGGTFTGTPEINTTYYLHSSNSVV